MAALALSALAFAALIWCFATDLADLDARLALLIAGVAEGLFAVPIRTRILGAVGAVDEPAHDLELLSQILHTIEGQTFHAPALSHLTAAIRPATGPAASLRIAKLRRLTDMLESRDNPIVRAIGPVVLWTTQLGMAVEAWRAASGAHVSAWLDAVSELEALSALANYAFEHPDDPFPEFAETSAPAFNAEELGHPLLAADHCVRNNVSLAPPLRLLIVSGSNMSGKSTLLRAIGVNTVLVLAGAPVRAKRLSISPLSLGASIRATDSLEEGHSRFMSEILRLKQILELPAPVLFLLTTARRHQLARPGRRLRRPCPRTAGAWRDRACHDPRPDSGQRGRRAHSRGRQRPFRGPARRRPARLRLPDARRHRHPQQRARSDARRRSGRVNQDKRVNRALFWRFMSSLQASVAGQTRVVRGTPAKLRDLEAAIETSIRGKNEAVRMSVVCLLARGHLLIEDVPGVGKTTLAQSLSRAVDCDWRRLQFTSDLLPSDVLGVTVYNTRSADFEFRPRGRCFTNFLLADEDINRTTPKTQSALLEAMNEHQVSVDGRSLPLPDTSW